MTPESALHILQRLMAQGKDAYEAVEAFGVPAFHAVMREEFETNSRFMSDPLFDIAVEHSRKSCENWDFAQATDLWLAGWTSEAQSSNSQVMSWYWRRPARRKNIPGRRYLSTNQAWMAMRREQGLPTVQEGRFISRFPE
jgi:hypothetical protein